MSEFVPVDALSDDFAFRIFGWIQGDHLDVAEISVHRSDSLEAAILPASILSIGFG
jgi:hypothetical protein